MEVKEKLEVSLINGQFEPNEALDILQNLISQKVNFHLVKNFNSEVRFGVQSVKSLDRIKALKEANLEILEIIQKATKEGHQLSVKANIQIEFV
ncbi:hypothetical protein [Shivajiella indica]|uniref:Uncharacterized protein n=1 Tax=Shivajiella indica TaxID=872115 RepID=A0ABW5B7I1_9BACT